MEKSSDRGNKTDLEDSRKRANRLILVLYNAVPSTVKMVKLSSPALLARATLQFDFA